MTVSTTSSVPQQVFDSPVSEQVLTAIATHEGSDPIDFDRPLYDAIDPDALDALFQSDCQDGQLTFTYRGYDVTVKSSDEIVLTPTDE